MMDVGFGNVDEEEILHGGVADVAVAITFGEISGQMELRGGDAAAEDGSADGEKAGLLLRDDTEMIAMDARRNLFGPGGVERVAKLGFHGGEEGLGGPVMLEEKELEARFLAGLAKHFGFAKDFGHGADDRDDLMRLDEGVETESEVGIGGKAAADADVETQINGRSGEWRVASDEFTHFLLEIHR